MEEPSFNEGDNPPLSRPTDSQNIPRVGLMLQHLGETDDGPMMSRPTDVLDNSFVCYQDLSEYVGLENIEQGFHCEPAVKKHY